MPPSPPRASGTPCGCNFPLHLHPVFNTVDIYGDGQPTRISFSDRDLRQGPGSMPNAEAVALEIDHAHWRGP